MIIRHISRGMATPEKQQGVVLFIALIVLVVMSLVGISMIRQGSSSQMIVGNLAFKEGAEAAADFGVESARQWLTALSTTGSVLESNNTPKYIANGLTASFDPTTDITFKVTSDELDRLKYEVSYVIHRLCDKAKPVVGEEPNAVTGKMEPTNNCILYSETSSKEGIDYGNAPVAGFMPYYRVTVRVKGPRNTTSYVQALLY